MVSPKNEYFPDYAVSPGTILEEILESRNISKSEFALRCGRPIKTISEIINGKTRIIDETAMQFERVLCVDATIWLNLESNYRMQLLRLKQKEKLKRAETWVKKFPYREMIQRGIIKDSDSLVDTVESLFKFFGVSSINAYEKHWNNRCRSISLRSSPRFESASESIAAWLRIGEIEAEDIETNPPYSRNDFKSALLRIRNLTRKDIAVATTKTQELCAKCGVIVLFVPRFSRMPVYGLAKRLSTESALIQLTLRHKKDDLFWFSFFHEAGHILLGKKRTTYLDDERGESEEEKKVNEFAENILIPKHEWRKFIDNLEINSSYVGNFAKKICIAPGIVVGRMQHENIVPFNHSLNKLKVQLGWKKGKS